MMTLGACFAVVATSCSPAPRADAGGFDSENPAAKLYAIHEAGEAHQIRSIPDLIAALDSDDPAVRMFAIKALEDMTGQRMGYSPYDPPYRRREAVDRWVAAYHRGDLPGGRQTGEVPGRADQPS